MAKLNQERFTAADFAIDSLNDPDTINNYKTVLSFEQPLFIKKAYVGLDMAGLSLKTSEMDLVRLRETTAFNVFQAYVNIIIAREYLDVAHKGVDDAKEHLRIAGVRYDSDLGLYSDVLRAKVAVADAEKGVVEAEKNVKVAKRMLGLLIGRNDSIDAAGEDIPSITLTDIEEYLGVAGDRADVKAMEMRYRNAKNAVKFAEADYYPMVGIGGSYELDDHAKPLGAEGKSWQVMAFLRVNLFDGLNRENERSKAVHGAHEAGEYLEGLKKKVDFEVYDAYYSVEEASKKYDLAMASKQSAEEGVRLIGKRYENSLAPMVSLLDSQTALDKARADVVAMHGMYYTALARLEFASGRLLKVLQVEE
jgi:outer membrane protein TolC